MKVFTPTLLRPDAAVHISLLLPYAATETILEPCALNAEFQHFIPRFNENFLSLWTSLKERFEG